MELTNCIVRSWEKGDASSLALHANCREVWRNLRDGFPHPYSHSDAVEFIHFCQQQSPETNFAIEVDGEAAGSIGFRLGTDVERGSAEVGYWLGEAHWGKGITTDALVAARDYAIAAYGLIRVFAAPFDWNPSSCRVLEKAGFVFEGRLRRSVIKDGQVIDQLLYASVIDAD